MHSSPRNAMKKLSVYEWHKQFREVYENTDDDESDCPRSQRTDEKVEEVQNLEHSLSSSFWFKN
jgi:hypothetical protein